MNRTFLVRRPGGCTVRLQLVDVGDAHSAPLAGTVGCDDCFCAVLQGPRSAPLTQGTYSVENDALGRFSLFLVPGGRPGQVLRYEAAFNRVVPGIS